MSHYVDNVDVERLGLQPGDEALDVGCGEGHVSRRLVEAGYRVTGVDPSARLRGAFAEAARDLPADAWTLVDATAEELPFPDGRFRAALITEVLEHVDDPVRVVRELSRVLAVGGRLCVSVPTSYTERLFSSLHPRYLSNATHERIFRKAELRGLLESAGLQVEHVEGRNFIPSVLWVFHAALRSEADHAGEIQEHLWVNRGVQYALGGLERLRLLPFVLAAGNRLFPKSWYVYAVKPG